MLGGNCNSAGRAMPIVVWPASPQRNKNSGGSGDPNIQNWCITPRIVGKHINCVLPYGYVKQHECTLTECC